MLVLGAGASQAAGYPLASELIDRLEETAAQTHLVNLPAGVGNLVYATGANRGPVHIAPWNVLGHAESTHTS